MNDLISCSNKPIFMWSQSEAINCTKYQNNVWFTIFLILIIFITFLFITFLIYKKRHRNQQHQHQHQHQNSDSDEKNNSDIQTHTQNSLTWIFIALVILTILIIIYFNTPNKIQIWQYWENIKQYFRNSGFTEKEIITKLENL